MATQNIEVERGSEASRRQFRTMENEAGGNRSWHGEVQRSPARDGWMRYTSGEQLARGLGWFSLGLGIAQIVAPRAVSKTIGVSPAPALMRTLGMRELVCGIGLLAQPRSGAWMSARVAGDLMDLVLLGLAFNSKDSRKGQLVAAASGVIGVTALDVLGSSQLNRAPREVVVEKSVTINRSPQECYRFWRDLENLPRFMKHVQSVQLVDDRRSHWKVTAPARTTVEWDSEITEDRPDEVIAWRSLDGADVINAGTVRFEPATIDRGTVVRVTLHYQPPVGRLGAAAAKLFGEEPSQQVYEDLRRFKQIMETGEIPTTRGQPSGRTSLSARSYRKLTNASEPRSVS